MNTLRTLLLPLLLLASSLSARAMPLAAAIPAPPTLGVNLQLPAKLIPGDEANAAEWRSCEQILAALPKGTPVRATLYFHEWAWSKATVYGFEQIDAKVRLMARYGLPVVWEVTPLPWPGSEWSPTQVWGSVALEDVDELDRRFKLGVALLRQSMARYGMPERGTRFDLGNEPGSTHPGGNVGLPRGEWYDRVGALYERMVRGTDFGAMELVLPAPSFQDEDPATALRERVSAGPILRKIGRAKKGGGAVADIHVRYFAPTEPTIEYAAHLLSRIQTRLAFAREISGRPYAICSEFYLFREDRGAVDDRAEVLRILAPKLPPGCFLYKVGSGGDDPSTELPVSAVRSAAGDVER